MTRADSDFSYLEGTSCYCSPEAAQEIRRAVAEMPLCAVHLLGTGDCHYVSLFWAERIEEPFTLVLWDNHPDDQPAAFSPDILSCGSWVCDVRALPLCRGTVWIREAGPCPEIPEGPCYLSVDLDVLSEEFAHTDWDQGEMTLRELTSSIEAVVEGHRIIGVDICGGLTEQKGASAADLALNAAATEAVAELFT